MDDDIKLMLELKGGNRQAFDKLLDKYEKRIINFIYRFTGNTTDSEDVAQEVFVRVYNAAGTYTPLAKYSTWIYRIAANAGVDYLRKKKRNLSAGSSLDEVIQGVDGPVKMDVPDNISETAQAGMERMETRKKVNKALLLLPDAQRAAIILRIYEEKSYDEIGKIIGSTVPAVESLLFRARQELRKNLENPLQSRKNK